MKKSVSPFFLSVILKPDFENFDSSSSKGPHRPSLLHDRLTTTTKNAEAGLYD